MKTIEVTVAPDGTAQVQTRGFAGRACLEASRHLEAELGLTTSAKLSSEFYANAERSERVALQRQPP